MWLIEELLRRFERSPALGKLLVTNTEVLLGAGMVHEVKEFVEFCINGEKLLGILLKLGGSIWCYVSVLP